MGLGVLFPIFHHCLENPRIMGHDLGLETHFHIRVFMREDLDRLREDLEPELLSLLLTAFPHVESHCAGDLVQIADLEFLDNAIWVLAREQSAEQEAFLFDSEHIRVDHVGHLLVPTGYHNLFFEDAFEVIGDDPRDATFPDVLI
jgi:hypothetical protein